MNKSFAIAFMLLLAACGGSGPNLSKPYKFDRERLDKLVREKKANYDRSKRNDGTLQWEKYYLADTVKYELTYDERSNLRSVTKSNEHGQPVWMEMYYPTGQRKSHYNMGSSVEFGHIGSFYEGYFEEYYENGNVKAMGEYKKQKMAWTQKVTTEGYPGDTIFYDYGEEKEAK